MRVYEAKMVYSLVSLGEEVQLDRASKVADYLRSAFEENPMQKAFYCPAPIARTKMTSWFPDKLFEPLLDQLLHIPLHPVEKHQLPIHAEESRSRAKFRWEPQPWANGTALRAGKSPCGRTGESTRVNGNPPA